MVGEAVGHAQARIDALELIVGRDLRAADHHRAHHKGLGAAVEGGGPLLERVHLAHIRVEFAAKARLK